VSRLDALLEKVAREQDVLRETDPMVERLAGRFHRYTPRARRSARGFIVLAAAVAACVALTVGVMRRPSALAVTVGSSGSVPFGAWLGAPDTGSLPLEFSDGSRFELTPKSRARLLALEEKSARVELGEGSLHVHVVPGHSNGWRIDAGPFGVRITGTRFDVSYRAADDVFELSVDEGQVELTGCVFGKGRKLAAGQRVRASCRTPRLDVSYREGHATAGAPAPAPVTNEAAPSIEPSASPVVTDATPTSAKPTTATSTATSATATVAPATWLSLAKAGKSVEAYAAAQREGFSSICEKSGAESLALLAEAARHAGAPRQSEQALVTLRRRFPGSAEAALAAFGLGRLQFDEFGAYSAAARSFRTYLKERPGGPMTREALGRLVEAAQREGDATGARAAAERYLRDYPSGPHAKLASRLVSSP
jgi:transmembrane sensor